MLQRSQIGNRKIFEAVDPENAELFFRLLRDNGYYVSKEKTRLIRKIPSYDHFAFRPSQKEMTSTSQKRLEIEGAGLWHQGVHVMFDLRFGDEIAERPRLTLLNECFGIGLDIYLSASLALVSPKQAWPNIASQYAESQKRLRQPFRRAFYQALRDPFAAYKKSVLAAFDVHWALFEIALASKEKKLLRLEQLVRDLNQTPELAFFFDCDFATPVLFLANYCGPKSSLEDLRFTKLARRELSQSRTMAELLNRFGIHERLANAQG